MALRLARPGEVDDWRVVREEADGSFKPACCVTAAVVSETSDGENVVAFFVGALGTQTAEANALQFIQRVRP